MEKQWSTLPGERAAGQFASGGGQCGAEVPLPFVQTQNGGGTRAEELAHLFAQSEAQGLPVKDRVEPLRKKNEALRVALQTLELGRGEHGGSGSPRRTEARSSVVLFFLQQCGPWRR